MQRRLTGPPLALLGAAISLGVLSASQEPTGPAPEVQSEADVYTDTVRPILTKYCFDCHGPKEQKAGVQLDDLDPDIADGLDTEEWHFALDMIQGAEMPPAKAPQMSDDESRALVGWIQSGLEDAKRSNDGGTDPVLRRLNRQQYAHTIRELLDLDIDFARVLPGDAKSKTGFTNNGETLQASPLHLDTYQEVARQALSEAIAIGPRPEAVRYRVSFGKGIGKGKVAASTGGYQAVSLSPNDFMIDILGSDGEVRAPKDDTEAEAMDDLRRKMSVGLRGSSQNRFKVTADGLTLYSAVPHKEVAPGAWQGPSPNAKLETQRVFPESGRLAMRIKASRGTIWKSNDVVLLAMPDQAPRARFLEGGADLVLPTQATVAMAIACDERKNLKNVGDMVMPNDVTKPSDARLRFALPKDGFYQIDLIHAPAPADRMPSIRLSRGNLKLDLRPVFTEAELAQERVVTNVGAAYLKKGAQQLRLGGPFFTGFSHLVITPIDESHDLVEQLDAKLADREELVRNQDPVLRVFAGTRTDDGMDYATFAEPQVITAPKGQAETYTFYGRLENLPVPEPESGDNEILSGFLLLGFWNDNLVKKSKETGPPLLVESIEIEAPYYEAWPPASHREIFFESGATGDENAYARDVIEAFLSRAFRRPVDAPTVDRYHAFWSDARPEFETFEESIREVFIAALCSPRFLYLAEPEAVTDGNVGAESPAVSLDDWALATRLSYFLWNSPPDEELKRLAESGSLRGALDAQCDRLLDDPRSGRFIEAFAHEWLRLDRFEQMTVDANRFPSFTRFVKRDMRDETLGFLEHVFANDMSALTLVDSDFAMLNQNLSEFYGIKGVVGPQIRAVEVPRAEGRGGLLSQGAFLTGHSDGVHPHPVKRAVWIKEKILGDAPPPPPPNVPDLDPDAPGFQNLTLKEQLERHRDSASCRDCHAGIDPYGVVFEKYSAVGLLEEMRKKRPIDATSVLPDGTAIDGVADLKRYLIETEADAVSAALIEHLFAYGLGRDVSFADEDVLDAIQATVRADRYRVRTVIKEIVQSPAFLR